MRVGPVTICHMDDFINDVSRMSMSRRRLLSATAWGMTAGMAVGTGARAEVTSPIDYTARATFDTAVQEFRAGGYNGQPNQPNDSTGGGLAWVQSYILMAFLRMYQAYGDTHYLDQLIDHADQILDMRDSVRDVTDYRGLSLPAWRSTNPYTAGSAILRDSSGNGLVELRTSASGANSAVATTFAGSHESTFSLRVTSSRYPTIVEEHRDLSMDSSSPDHIVRRIYETFNPYGLNVTARLSGKHESRSLPTLGAVPFVAQPVIFSADTGMITYAIAGLVRTILADNKLRRDPRYRRTAMIYLRAVEQAITVHEPEWCEERIGSQTIGYYRWTKGMFRSYDGTEQPLNWSHAIGQTLVELAAATRNPRYIRKVKLLAAMQAHEWALDSAGAYRWHYWPKFGSMYSGYQRTGSPKTDISLFTPEFPASTKPEDISHAAISVEFAARAFEEGLAFTKSDITRLIATYTQNLARIGPDGIPTTASSVDGSGDAPASYYLQAPRWIPLARWNPAIFEHSLSIYRARRPSLMAGHALLAISYFNWYRRRGEH